MKNASTSRVRLYRERKASCGLSEVRGVFAPTEFHPSIKSAAAGLMSSANRSSKIVGLILMERDGLPAIDFAASAGISIDELIAFLETVPDSIRATIAQLEHDSH